MEFLFINSLKKFYLLNKFTSIFLFVHYLRNKSKKVLINLEKFETKNRIFDKQNQKALLFQYKIRAMENSLFILLCPGLGRRINPPRIPCSLHLYFALYFPFTYPMLCF